MNLKSLRRRHLSRHLFKWARKALPGLSDTEREALEAGDVWWDRALFSGNPDWNELLDTPAPKLSEAELAFLNGPVEELCAMVSDWDINWKQGDLSPEVWDFIRRNKFFAMIIPRAYGGLEFSAYAHSEVIRRISSRSIVTAVTVMVPNSLGPGELLLQFGTKAQQDYWLPRLADGSEVPCFGLTSPDAGSDASAMKDTGVVCRGTFDGEEVLGIRLNWHKRYITLGPVATVLGLAFKLKDPEHLLSEEEERGITVALVPTDLPGVEIGRRHLPSLQMFQNGPNWGKDVFIPLDYVIGGEAQVGKGWSLLMSALAAGRGISLPSLGAAATAFSARSSGAYARIRHQFNIPISKFEGIQESLGRLAVSAYTLDAARRLTCSALDQGRHPSVISAIMKCHATYRMRGAVDDAMDIHGGKAIIDGPMNYIGNLHRSVPLGITVEGANILTRSMIIFGQGVIRGHPWVLQEMLSLEKEGEEALEAFDASFWGHIGHFFTNLGRCLLRNWSGGLIGPAPRKGVVRKYYRQLGRYSASFALLADLSLVTYGGALKRKEMISGRMGDILAELYFLSAVLKRWEDEGRQQDDLPLVHHAMADGIARMQHAIQSVLANLDNRPLAWFGKLALQPLGVRRQGAKDRLIKASAELLTEDSPTRERLTAGLYLKAGNTANGVAALEDAFRLAMEVAPLLRNLKDAHIRDPDEGLAKGIIDQEERERLRTAAEAAAIVIAVDDFAPDELLRQNATETEAGQEESEQVAPEEAAAEAADSGTVTPEDTQAEVNKE